MKLAIYGAQSIAFGTYKAIKELFSEQEILGFIVSEMGTNTHTLGGIPVMELDDFLERTSQDEMEKLEVLIATPENVMQDIETNLNRAGINHYVCLDSLRWAELVRNAFLRSGKFLPLAAYVVGHSRVKLHVFKMIHSKDKLLKTQYQDKEYIRTLQVGSAGSLEIESDYKDHQGDNISEKNGNYSELTGLYWIWKNHLCMQESDDYYGLAHYRRQLDLSDDDILRLKDNAIDVVLPYSMPYDPNIEVHHKRYLSDDEWGAVLEALRELYPEYAKAFKDILGQEYLYNYNIILARREVLEKYCAWLFPLLFKIEELNDPDGTKRPNRFIGYIGENLETLYFMYNRYRLKIAYSGVRFLT